MYCLIWKLCVCWEGGGGGGYCVCMCTCVHTCICYAYTSLYLAFSSILCIIMEFCLQWVMNLYEFEWVCDELLSELSIHSFLVAEMLMLDITHRFSYQIFSLFCTISVVLAMAGNHKVRGKQNLYFSTGQGEIWSLKFWAEWISWYIY